MLFLFVCFVGGFFGQRICCTNKKETKTAACLYTIWHVTILNIPPFAPYIGQDMRM